MDLLAGYSVLFVLTARSIGGVWHRFPDLIAGAFIYLYVWCIYSIDNPLNFSLAQQVVLLSVCSTTSVCVCASIRLRVINIFLGLCNDIDLCLISEKRGWRSYRFAIIRWVVFSSVYTEFWNFSNNIKYSSRWKLGEIENSLHTFKQSKLDQRRSQIKSVI